MFELDEEFGELNDRCYHHGAGEVWHVASSPHSRDLISTCHSHVESEVRYKLHTIFCTHKLHTTQTPDTEKQKQNMQ